MKEGLCLGTLGDRSGAREGVKLATASARPGARAWPSSPSPGLCGMVAISWYAFNITQEFFDPLYPGTK